MSEANTPLPPHHTRATSDVLATYYYCVRRVVVKQPPLFSFCWLGPEPAHQPVSQPASRHQPISFFVRLFFGVAVAVVGCERGSDEGGVLLLEPGEAEST